MEEGSWEFSVSGFASLRSCCLLVFHIRRVSILVAAAKLKTRSYIKAEDRVCSVLLLVVVFQGLLLLVVMARLILFLFVKLCL